MKSVSICFETRFFSATFTLIFIFESYGADEEDEGLAFGRADENGSRLVGYENADLVCVTYSERLKKKTVVEAESDVFTLNISRYFVVSAAYSGFT